MAIAIINIIIIIAAGAKVTCSKLIIKTLEERVNLFKVNYKDTRRMSLMLFWYLHCYFAQISHLVLVFLLLLWTDKCSLRLKPFQRPFSLLDPIFSLENIIFGWKIRKMSWMTLFNLIFTVLKTGLDILCHAVFIVLQR